MQKSRLFLFASAAVLVLGLAAGLIAYLAQSRTAPGRGVPAEIRFVPPDAALVAYADVRAVMSSDLRRELMPAIERRSRRGREMMSDFAGIDLETQVDHVMAYVERTPDSGDAGQPPERAPGNPGAPVPPEAPPAGEPADPRMPRGLMIVQGSFEQDRIEQFIRSHGGTIETHNGRHISVRRDGSEDVAVGFLRPGLLAVGQARLVRRALDHPQTGSAPSGDLTSNGDVMALVRDASDGTAWVVGHFDALTNGMKLPDAMSRQVPPLRLMSAKAKLNGGLQATIRAEAADQAAADELRDVVRGFLALARLQAARPEFQSTLKSVQLSGVDKTVQLTFAIAPEHVRSLAPRPPAPLPEPPPPQ